MSPTIPFKIPAEFLQAYHSGAVQQVGALLKDQGTGKIVAHLQETGALQNIAQSFLSGGPVGALTSGVQIAQNHVANKKLDALTGMVGNLQNMQLFTAATSVAGIGVTVASTLIIMNRLKGLERSMGGIEARLDALPATFRDMKLQNVLRDVVTLLERVAEAPARKDPKPVLLAAVDGLHDAFNKLDDGARDVVMYDSIDADLLRQLLDGLAVSGGAQIKVLFELDEKKAALDRSKAMFQRLQDLSRDAPKDLLLQKLGDDAGARIADQLSTMRLTVASQPSLTQHLIDMEVSGSAYIRAATEEADEPLLVLPLATG